MDPKNEGLPHCGGPEEDDFREMAPFLSRENPRTL